MYSEIITTWGEKDNYFNLLGSDEGIVGDYSYYFFHFDLGS